VHLVDATQDTIDKLLTAQIHDLRRQILACPAQKEPRPLSLDEIVAMPARNSGWGVEDQSGAYNNALFEVGIRHGNLF